MTDVSPRWTWTTLGKIAQTSLGKRLDREGQTGDHGVPYLRTSNVRWGKIDSADTQMMDIEPRERERFRLTSGDLLVCEGGEIGRCAVWSGSADYVAFQNTLHRVRPVRRVNTQFLRYQLEYLAEIGALTTFATGTTIKHLPQHRLRQLPIGLPSAAEQQRIVNALDLSMSRIDSAMDHIDRASERLGLFAKQIRTTYVTAGYQSADASAPLPEGWRWGTLSDVIATIEAGESWRCQSRRAEPNEWGLIKVSAMTWGEFRAEENKAVDSNRIVDTDKEIRPGDLLLSRANTSEHVGAAVLVGQCRSRLLLSDKSLRLIPRHDVDKQWLLELLMSPLVRDQVSDQARGTLDSMRNISRKSLGATVIPIPPPADQLTRSAKVSEIIDNTNHLSEAVSRTGLRAIRLRRSLIATAFAGILTSCEPGEENPSDPIARLDLDHAARSAVLPKQKMQAVQEMLW